MAVSKPLMTSSTELGPLTATALTPEQQAEAKAELGSGADLADLQVRYDRLGDFAAAITEVLRERLATFQSSPAQFGVEGYNQNTTENIRALKEKLAAREGGGESGLPFRVVLGPLPRRR